MYLKRVIIPKAADKSLRNLLQRDASLTPYKKTKPDASNTYGNSVLFPVINSELIEVYRNLEAANVGLNVIDAKFSLTYSHIFTNSNDTVDVLYNFRTETKVIRAQAYM
jgi:hypothetical protein